MTEFLQREIEEIDAVRAAHGQELLNKWFDQSGAKDRFKKARIKDQRLRCCYCRKFNATTYSNEWDLEHILCEDIYPQFFVAPGNLAIACKRCNGAKRQSDVYIAPIPPIEPLLILPEQSERYSIPHPRIDAWEDHLSHVNYEIYISKTPKGLQLMDVCKLNEPAMKEAGLTRETVVTALRTNFFNRVGNLINDNVSDDEVVAAMSSIVEDLEEMRADALIVGLENKIRKLERTAARRTTEKALAEAFKIAGPQGARALDIKRQSGPAAS